MAKILNIFNREGIEVSDDICFLQDFYRVPDTGLTPGSAYEVSVQVVGTDKVKHYAFRENLVADASGKIELTDLQDIIEPYYEGRGMVSVSIKCGTDGRDIQVVYSNAEVSYMRAFLENHFMTNYTSKRTAIGRREVLRAMAFGEIETAQVRAYFTDGSYEDVPVNVVHDDSMSYWRDDEGEEYCVFDCVDIDVSSIQFERPELTLYRYVAICGDRTMEYIMDPDHEETETVLLYQNCFGCYDYLYCNGMTEQDVTFERLSANINGMIRNYKVKETRVWTIDTGVLDRKEKETVLDVLRSRRVFLCKHDDGEIKPWKEITIKESEAKSNDEDSNMPRYKITCRMAQRQQNVFDLHQFPEIFTEQFTKTYE